MSAPLTKPSPQEETEHAASTRVENSFAAVPRISIYGARIAAVTERECANIILDALDAQRGGWVMTMNLDHLRRFVKQPAFTAAAARADLIVADGMPLVWASRLQKTPLPERVTGSNLLLSLSDAAGRRGRSVFLLGGSDTLAQRCAEKLRGMYPHFHLAGTHTPPFGFEHDPVEMEKMCTLILRAQPDIVFLALGSPKQEQVIALLRNVIPHAWCIGVGISFSWVAGDLPRAPRWMQQAGLEWLHRLAHEPRRLMRRYLIDDLPFAARLFAHAWQQRNTNKQIG